MITFDRVTKKFGEITALHEFTLTITRGELFSLVGPNGAGKTTAIRLACGILHPTSGKIIIDGQDIDKNSSQVKRKIGYLPEEPNLYTRPTARELLEYFADLYGKGRERIDELLELVGLSERADSPVSTFSKGMRQRLALARSIVHDPEIMIFDEPTMGLDPATSVKVRNFIASLKKEEKTIILCTHYMEEADMLSDRVGFLNSGRIVSVGTPLELKSMLKKDNIYEIIFTEPVDISSIATHIISREKNGITATLSPQLVEKVLQEYGKKVFSIKSLTPTLADVFLKVTE